MIRCLRSACLTVVVLLAAAAAPAARAQSVLGLSIGDSAGAVSRLGVAAKDSLLVGPMSIRGYDLPDGGRFEVAVDNQQNRFVFLQHSRLGAGGQAPGDLPGSTYGQTTLAELRARCGSNGFAYPGGPGPSVVGDRYVLTNAYDIAGQPLVVMFLTTLPADEVEKLKAAGPQGAAALGDRAVLAGMILARREYLETVWGAERISDDPCPPLAWGGTP